MAAASQMKIPGQPVAPGTPPVLPAPPETIAEIPPEKTALQTHIEQMKPQVDVLLNNAKKGASADAVADMVVNMTPEEKLNQLYEFIAGEKCIENLIKINPDVQNYLPFFEALRARVKWLLIPEGEGDTILESGAEGSDTEGAVSDAVPGADAGDDKPIIVDT